MTGRIGTTKQLFPVQQAFASEKAFGVLSETLYELLQLVSESLSYASHRRICPHLPRQRKALCWGRSSTLSDTVVHSGVSSCLGTAAGARAHTHTPLSLLPYSFFFFQVYFILYVCMFCWHVCMCTMCVGCPRRSEGAWEPREL